MSDSETNGNLVEDRKRPFLTNGSMEDLSEYTDADESISAPTEILAEFLSAIMLKDYETALKYCQLILHYEPNNSTAREFYPLIIEKIKIMRAEYDSDEESSSDFSDSASSASSNNLYSSNEGRDYKADSDATSASYSSLEDEEADRENNVKEPVNIPLLAKDIENGNLLETEESNTTEEMLPFSATGKGEKKSCEKRNEDLKRKLEQIIGDRRVLHTGTLQNSSSFANSNNNNNNYSEFGNGNLSLSPNLRLYKSSPKQEKLESFNMHKNAHFSYCNPMKLSTEKVSKMTHRPPFTDHSKSASDPSNSKIKK